MFQKIRQEKYLNYVKMTLYSHRFLNCDKMTRYSQRFQVLKCPNTLKLCTLKALLSENWFCLIFLIF